MTTDGGHAAFLQLMGTGYFESNVAITHDDGFYLTLLERNTSTIAYSFDYSNAVATQTDTVNLTEGYYDFVLNYAAWNGYPENLVVARMAPVPEPATMLSSAPVSRIVMGKKKVHLSPWNESVPALPLATLRWGAGWEDHI